jgi:hypothetical protein
MTVSRRRFLGLVGGAGAAAVMPKPLLGLAVEPAVYVHPGVRERLNDIANLLDVSMERATFDRVPGFCPPAPHRCGFVEGMPYWHVPKGWPELPGLERRRK